VDQLATDAEQFESSSVRGLLRSAPDLSTNLAHINSMFTLDKKEKTVEILPTEGADPDCDEADEAVLEIEAKFESLKQKAKKTLK
jgi:DNA mismatch repair protein MSH6